MSVQACLVQFKKRLTDFYKQQGDDVQRQFYRALVGLFGHMSQLVDAYNAQCVKVKSLPLNAPKRDEGQVRERNEVVGAEALALSDDHAASGHGGGSAEGWGEGHDETEPAQEGSNGLANALVVSGSGDGTADAMSVPDGSEPDLTAEALSQELKTELEIRINLLL